LPGQAAAGETHGLPIVILPQFTLDLAGATFYNQRRFDVTPPLPGHPSN
jgi:hypothetical protein